MSIVIDSPVNGTVGFHVIIDQTGLIFDLTSQHPEKVVWSFPKTEYLDFRIGVDKEYAKSSGENENISLLIHQQASVYYYIGGFAITRIVNDEPLNFYSIVCNSNVTYSIDDAIECSRIYICIR